jgi:hypothetical protein
VKSHNIPSVVLAGRWALPSLGFTEAELEEGRSQVLLYDSSTKKLSLRENGDVFLRGLRRLLSDSAMKGRRLTLIIDVPDTGVDTPRYLAHSTTLKTDAGTQELLLPESPYTLQSALVDDQLLAIAKSYDASTVDLKSELCRAEECLVARAGHSLYRDSHHLTIFGALQLRKDFGQRSSIRYTCNWFRAEAMRAVILRQRVQVSDEKERIAGTCTSYNSPNTARLELVPI